MQKTSPEITDHNKIRLLFDGRETLSSIKEALNSAHKYINLEYFLIRDDVIGNTIKNILIERAKNGVNVRVIFDAVGSWRLSQEFICELMNAGVQVIKFMPVNLRNIAEIIHRDHRKIIVVDGKTGLLGGVNLGDVYLRQWRDTHLLIEGEAVRTLDEAFADMWNKCSENKYIPEKQDIIFDSDNVRIKIITSGTGKNFRAIADEYINVIDNAENRVWITTPYLAPDKKFLNGLYNAALRGVDVRIIIPSRSNHILVAWASQSYIDEMLKNNVRVFIYNGRFIHAKTLIADSMIASVGTANLDSLSFHINYEVQAFIYSNDTAYELEKIFLDDMNNCTEESLDKRKYRSVIQKLKENTGRLLANIL